MVSCGMLPSYIASYFFWFAGTQWPDSDKSWRHP